MSDILWWTLTLFAKFPEHRKHEKITSNKLYFSFSFIQSWFYYPKLSDNFSTPAKVVLMSKLLRMEWLLFSWKRSNNGGFWTKKSNFWQVFFSSARLSYPIWRWWVETRFLSKVEFVRNIIDHFIFCRKNVRFRAAWKMRIALTTAPALPCSFWACGFKLLGARGAIK